MLIGTIWNRWSIRNFYRTILIVIELVDLVCLLHHILDTVTGMRNLFWSDGRHFIFIVILWWRLFSYFFHFFYFFKIFNFFYFSIISVLIKLVIIKLWRLSLNNKLASFILVRWRWIYKLITLLITLNILLKWLELWNLISLNLRLNSTYIIMRWLIQVLAIFYK